MAGDRIASYLMFFAPPLPYRNMSLGDLNFWEASWAAATNLLEQGPGP